MIGYIRWHGNFCLSKFVLQGLMITLLKTKTRVGLDPRFFDIVICSFFNRRKTGTETRTMANADLITYLSVYACPTFHICGPGSCGTNIG